jgi:hypothetical protein
MVDQAGVQSAIGVAGWYDTQQTFLQGLIPSLTQFERVKFGIASTGNVTVPGTISDGALTGGAIAITGAGGTPIKLQTGSGFQLMKTGPWAWSARVKYPAISAGDFSHFGWADGGGTHVFLIGEEQGVSGTKFVVEWSGAGSTNTATTLNADTLVHTVGASFDGSTTFNVYIDGNIVLAAQPSTNLFDGAMFLSSVSSGALGVCRVSRAIYGFVDP